MITNLPVECIYIHCVFPSTPVSLKYKKLRKNRVPPDCWKGSGQALAPPATLTS